MPSSKGFSRSRDRMRWQVGALSLAPPGKPSQMHTSRFCATRLLISNIVLCLSQRFLKEVASLGFAS